MNNIYQKNLAALAKKNNDLAQKIKNLQIKKDDFTIVETKDASDYILKIKFDENKTKTASSIYNPKKSAEQKINKLNLDYYNLIGVMGIGCGYYIEEMINRFNKDCRLVIWENRVDILKEVLKHRDLTHVFESKNTIIFDGSNSDYFINMKKNLKFIVYMALLAGNVDFFELPALKEKERENYDEFKHQFISLMRYLARVMGNCPKDSLIGVENILKNIEYLLRSNSLDKINEYRGKPVVCVAAGPSLDKNITVLKKHQKKVLIIAADTILEKLLNHGIVPDIVGVLERTEHPYDYFFKDLIDNNDLPSEVTLVGEGVMDQRFCENFPGEKIITLRDTVYSEDWFSNNIEGVTGYDPGNSVATLNFATALSLGGSPIVLVGQDLAFGKDDEQHVGGTGYDEQGEKEVREEDIMTTAGYYNNEVKTKKVWWQFKKWFEYKIEETGVHCIDATEGGAYINGTKRMKLEQVAKEYFNEEKSFFKSVIREVDGAEFKKRAKDLKGKIEGKENVFIEIKDKAFLIKDWMEEVLEEIDNLNGEQQKVKYIFEVFPDLNRELVVLTRSDPFFSFVCQPLTIEMERNKVRMGDLEIDTETKFIEWCQQNIKTLGDIEKICEELIENFQSGKNKVNELIIEEEKKND